MLPDPSASDHESAGRTPANAAAPAGVIGIGLDLVEIDRMRETLTRWGSRFVDRVFDASEHVALSEPRAAQHFAARFAAKEACAKAFGTGIDEGLSWRDIRVRNEPSGRPVIALHGRASELAARLSIGAVHLSISHSRGTAAAVVVLERAAR